jgi:hypothetical protein
MLNRSDYHAGAAWLAAAGWLVKQALSGSCQLVELFNEKSLPFAGNDCLAALRQCFNWRTCPLL